MGKENVFEKALEEAERDEQETLGKMVKEDYERKYKDLINQNNKLYDDLIEANNHLQSLTHQKIELEHQLEKEKTQSSKLVDVIVALVIEGC